MTNTTTTQTTTTKGRTMAQAFKTYKRIWTNDIDGDQVTEASQVITLVRVDGHTGLYVQITTGSEVGDDFVGLYDLDGERVDFGNCTWSLVEDLPADAYAELLRGFAGQDGEEFITN